MNLKKSISALLALTGFVAAFASQEFIAHRFEIFKSAPISEGEIIFLGNSITNFHNWNEAFARPGGAGLGEGLIGNRGVSDGRAYQWKENVQVILDGPVKPKKLFICIGTNDLNLNIAPATVANDIRAIIRHVQVAAPETEIFLETIPPRSGATNTRVNICNALLEPLAAEMGVNFIYTTDELSGLPSGGEWSYEGLHPKGHGYRKWCRFIAPQVGLDCVYGDGTQVNGPLDGCVPVVRANQFGLLPVEDDDILVVSDAWGDGVLWHELVGNHNVKNRSTGSGNLNFEQAKQWLDISLTHSPEIQKCPRAIVLAWGISEVYSSGTNFDTYKQHVLELAAYAKQLAPAAKIILCQVPPLNAASATPVATANAKLAEITEYPVVDIAEAGYTGSVWDQGADNSLTLKAQGAIWIAKALSKTLNAEFGAGTATPVDQADFESFYANRNRRIDIGIAYNSLYQREYVRNSTVGAAAIKQLEDNYLKGSKTFTDADVAAAQELAASTLAAVPFKVDPTKFHRITTTNPGYNLTNSGYSVVAGDATVSYQNLDPTASFSADIWQFLPRPDGTFNIKNAMGLYLIPGTTISAGTTAPSAGWNVTPSDHQAGSCYTISCASPVCTINYNGATNFNIIEYVGEAGDPMVAPVVSGWYEITSRQTGKHIVTVDKVYRQTDANSYSLKYTNALPADETRQWLYIDVQGNNTYFRCSNGYYVVNSGCNALTPMNLKGSGAGSNFPGLINKGNDYILFRWNEWGGNPGDALATEAPYLGAGGTDSARVHDFKRVLPERLAKYDLWTVNIVANNPANKFRDHTRVTYHGVTVYNGGTLFVEAGKALAATDFTVTPAEGMTQSAATPSIFIDAVAKTVNVSYNAGITSGWNNIEIGDYTGTRADVTGWTNTVINDGRTNLVTVDSYMPQTNQSRRYHISLAEVDPTKPAAAFYKVVRSDNAVRVQTVNGHFIGQAGSGSRDAYDAPTTATDDPSKVQIAWVAWNGSNLTNKPTTDTYALGQFGAEKCNFTFTPSSIADFDIYSVKIIGEVPAPAFENDVQITYTGAGNAGIPSVYNGGTFFIAKGTPVTAESFSVPAHNGNSTPEVTLSGGVLTVDYSLTPDHSDIIEVTDITLTPAEVNLEVDETVTVQATLAPESAAEVPLCWMTDNEAVATVNANGTITAMGVGTAIISIVAQDAKSFVKQLAVTVKEKELHVEPEPEPEVVLVSEITVAPAEVTLYIGESAGISVTVLPADATNPALTWTSANDAVATVSEGIISAVAPGNTTVTVAASDNSGASQTVAVTVSEQSAIDELTSPHRHSATAIYDLQGRRVAKPAKGVYIQGSKVIVSK